MQFDLEAEQQLLSDSVARFVGAAYPFETRARRLAAEPGGSAEIWATFADNGWLAAALPEIHGGLGGSVLETVIIAQQLGRGLVVEPYLGCAVMAAQTLAAAATEAQRQSWLPRLADGSSRLALAYSEPAAHGFADRVEARARRRDGGWRLNGVKTLVLGGAMAHGYIVSARAEEGLSLFMVTTGTPGLAVTPTPLHDGQMAVQLVLNDVLAAELLGVAGEGLAGLREGLAHGVLVLCAELIGVMERTIEITADYLRTRQQFGGPLAGFQVLQHGMADMAAALELARSMLFAALASFENDTPAQRDAVLSSAKAFISRTALQVCGQGVQFHGAIGMTEEYSIGHYFKRAVVGGVVLGANSLHEAACAEGLQTRAAAATTAPPRLKARG